MIKFYVKILSLSFVISTVCLTTVNGASNKTNLEVDYNTKGITVNYNIVNLPEDSKPFTVNDTLYVPLRFFAETLGYSVENYLDTYINVNDGYVSRYLTQSNLLKDAMNYVGVDTPDKAVNVWSEGLKQRSAAMQYSVMTKELKDIYAKDLEQSSPNWVTGISSPWVEGYEIINKEKSNINSQTFHIKYSTATSAGEFEPFYVTLKIVKDADFWRISEVNGDESSTVYTGFVLKKQ